MALTQLELPVQTIRAGDHGRLSWRRSWLTDAVRSRDSVLVERLGMPASVLLVDDGSRELRWWLRRLVESIHPARVRCLGVVDVSLPWYAGLGFSLTELMDALRAAQDEAWRNAQRATRAKALWLSRHDVPAVAECSIGRFAEIVLTRAAETRADLVVLSARGHAPAELRTIIERAACSVLIVRGVPDGRGLRGLS